LGFWCLFFFQALTLAAGQRKAAKVTLKMLVNGYGFSIIIFLGSSLLNLGWQVEMKKQMRFALSFLLCL